MRSNILLCSRISHYIQFVTSLLIDASVPGIRVGFDNRASAYSSSPSSNISPDPIAYTFGAAAGDIRNIMAPSFYSFLFLLMLLILLVSLFYLFLFSFSFLMVLLILFLFFLRSLLSLFLFFLFFF